MSTQESPAGAGLVTDVADLASHVGAELGHTEWREMTQERVNQFADVTDDHNFIHVDPERAKDTVFGGTIAHGFLTMSMLAPMAYQACPVVKGSRTNVNYGFNRLRFVAPVPVGSRVRAHFVLHQIERIDDVQRQIIYTVTVEIEGAAKPALVAEWLTRITL